MQIARPDGSVTAWTYDTSGQIISTVFPNGATEIIERNSSSHVTKRYLPKFNGEADQFERYTYYPSGHPWADRVKTFTDARNHTITYEYDLKFINNIQGEEPTPGRGLITKIIYADGTYVKNGYSIYGEKIWEENELQQRTSTTYDEFNRLKSRTDPLNNTLLYNYQPTFGPDALNPNASEFLHTISAPKYIIFPSGRKVSYVYDHEYRKIQQTSGAETVAESIQTYEYDAVGNLTKNRAQIDATTWRETTYAYDSRNRKRFEYAPLGRTTEWQYDAVGNVTKVIYPDGTFRTKTYDSMNRVLTDTDERGFTTTFTYHPSGKVNTITDARGSVHSHTYDASDRLLVRTYPNGSTESWTYDAVGNTATYTNRSGQTLRYTYDSRDRETHRTWDGNVAPAVTTTYDAAGRVLTRINGNSSNSYAYDAVGRVTSETQTPSGATSVTFTYGYDADGNRTTLSSTLGQTLGYAYNARGELTQINHAEQSVGTYSYNLAGQRITRTLGNQTQSSYAYDEAGRLIALATGVGPSGPSILGQRYGHDLRDRRKWSLRDETSGDAYDYLPDGQLSRYRHEVFRPDLNFENPAAWTDIFAYDGVGNRTSLNENGMVITYEADSLNQYTNVTGTALSYNDGRGNLTQWQDWNFAYDADNRLVSCVVSIGCPHGLGESECGWMNNKPTAKPHGQYAR